MRPIPYTLTPKAAGYLDPLSAELDPAEPVTVTGTPPSGCGPDCPAPDHHGAGPRPGASDMPATHTGNSSQAQMIEATAADAGALRSARDMYRALGWTEREAETGQWLAVAEQDHAAAVAGIDYRHLAAMGPESVMTEPEPCGYPGDLEPEAGT